MATESVATAATKPNDEHEKDLDRFNRVMDSETAEALFRAMSILALSIEATDGRSLDRIYLEWPNVGRAVWELLDGVMIRARVSDGKEHPWDSEAETKTHSIEVE
jgi:hypothetical protein